MGVSAGAVFFESEEAAVLDCAAEVIPFEVDGGGGVAELDETASSVLLRREVAAAAADDDRANEEVERVFTIQWESGTCVTCLLEGRYLDGGRPVSATGREDRKDEQEGVP